MPEKEKREGVQNQFPKIPKSTVDRLIEDASRETTEAERERNLLLFEIREYEPILLDVIESVAAAYDDRLAVTAGAIAVYKIFKEYEKTGFTFPRVSEELVLAFTNEYLNAGEPPEKINAFFSLKSTGIELTNPLLSPYHYAEENPHLMVFLAGLPDHMQIGGMLIYELKRRQFHADQLTATWG